MEKLAQISKSMFVVYPYFFCSFASESRRPHEDISALGALRMRVTLIDGLGYSVFYTRTRLEVGALRVV